MGLEAHRGRPKMPLNPRVRPPPGLTLARKERHATTEGGAQACR